MKFIDRARELRFLEEKYNSDKAELIILYGRRRIGKTELLRQFIGNKTHIYFLGRLESKEDTIKRFNNSLLDLFKDLSLAKRRLANWDEIFDYLWEKTQEERIIIALDEFPFIVEKFPEIVSLLQDKFDNLFIKSRVMIILCGSSISMMEKYAVDYKSPLYGRRTGTWLVDKLDLKYLVDFFPTYTLEDLLIVYSCLDTIPGYLVKFSPSTSVWENIRQAMLSKGEFLYDEVEILLREELRDPSNYLSILTAIAGGATSLSEIHSRTMLDKSLLSKYLFILEKLGMVEKVLPVIASYKGRLKAKGSAYYLKDNFIDFWLRFVYLNKSDLEIGRADEVNSRIKREINTFLGRKFEQFIMKLIPAVFPSFQTAGRWWHRDREIDLVALNEEAKEILFCECKWQERVDAAKVIAELKAKASYVQWNSGKRKEHYAIFAKSYKEKIKTQDEMLFDLKDIEKALRQN